MQVPSELLDCVAFLAYRGKKAVELAGTCFFVGVPSRVFPRAHTVYAVTAKHVIDEINLRATDDNVLIRVNLKGGKWSDARVPIKNWFCHPTDSIDVAVIQLEWLDEFDHRVFPVAGFITSEDIEIRQFGGGDEVLIAGLFSQHHGVRSIERPRNVPILRVGTVAAMPIFPIQCSWGTMDAFLINTVSIGGLSGSPVFAQFEGWRAVQGGATRLRAGYPEFACIGLVHGHFIEGKENAGIAVVVPFTSILKVLNSPELDSIRESNAQKHLSGENFTLAEMPTIDLQYIIDRPSTTSNDSGVNE